MYHLKNTVMKKNIGPADRIIRVIVALILTTLYFTGLATGILGIVVLVLGSVFMLTSAISFCPLYAVVERIWSLSDDCGATQIDTQLIYLIDTLAPVFSPPLDTTIQADFYSESNIYGFPLSVSDDCGTVDTSYLDLSLIYTYF